MKKLLLKKDVVGLLSNKSQITGGAQPSQVDSCQVGICIVPPILDWLKNRRDDTEGSGGTPVPHTQGAPCVDAPGHENQTMASCRYTC